ncbi:MAG: penicillin-binding transpeptidase domain-containing protein [Bacillota bacterium]
MGSQSRRRLLALALAFLVMYAALAAQLGRWQLWHGFELATAARQQRLEIVGGQPARGHILDRDLEALHRPQWIRAVALFPTLLNDQRGREELASILDFSAAQLAEAVKGAGAPTLYPVAVSEQQIRQIEAAGITGVIPTTALDRYGPTALARHLVGYTSASGRGVAGLEAQFDAELSGKLGQPLDLVTTLDARIQAAAERALAAQTTHGAAVVVEASTGELLAAVSLPTFDQSRPELVMGRNDGPLFNRCLMGQGYTPGSVFKILVAVAALEEGVVRLDDWFYCSGQVHPKWPACYARDRGGHGAITFAEAISLSCNSVFIEVGQKLGKTRLLSYARRLGFGELTGTGLGDESVGFLPDPGRLHGGDLANLSIGQGQITVTPLQLARAMVAIANGGLLPELKLIKGLRNSRSAVLLRKSDPPHRVMSTHTACALQEALLKTTLSGTGKAAWVPEFGSAGKTGSAEVYLNGSRSVHAWFAGYVPVRSPRYAIVVFVEEGTAGGVDAAPVFRAIAEELMSEDDAWR